MLFAVINQSATIYDEQLEGLECQGKQDLDFQ